MKYLENRFVQLGGVVLLILSLVILYGGEGKYGRSLAASVPTVTSLLTGLTIGIGLTGLYVLIRYLIKRHGKITFIAILALLILIGDTSGYNSPISTITSSISGFFGFALGVAIVLFLYLKARIRFIPSTKLPNAFGSSRWAILDDLKEWELLGQQEENNGLFLGTFGEDEEAIIYEGDMHALTIAPTRTGKGATAIIPNLLRSNSSFLVIDPKGENARRTASKHAEMGQQVYVVDPWGISLEDDKYGEGIDPDYISTFNPLEFLDPNDPDLTSDTMLLADALVVSNEKDPFWSDEAKALIHGFILYVVTEEQEEGNRHLGRVRDILSLPPASEGEDDVQGTMDEVLLNMAGSDHSVVRQAAFRFRQKAEKERSGVLSTAQSNTHFLDSPKIRQSLTRSGFRFKDLKTGEKGISVYLVLPIDRLSTFNRWLRLLISSALIDLTREKADPSKPPVRVILDEFAALQKLTLVETAYATMAGLGVQLWAFTQDLGQLKKLYGRDSWSTFAANSGVISYYGSRDYETAKYAEHLCGMTTMKKWSLSFGKNESYSFTSGGQSSSSTRSHGTNESISIDDVSRPLAYADEMMTLHRDNQVLFIENRYPIAAKKWWWFGSYKIPNFD